MRVIGVVMMLALLCACGSPSPHPTETPPPTSQPPESAWGAISRLATAPVFHPPALIGERDGFFTAAFTPLGTRWRLMLYRDDTSIETNLTADNPYALSLYPDGRDELFAVWLDYSGGRGGLLYVAKLSKTGVSDLGSILVSPDSAPQYSATPTADGRLWLVWSAAPIPESVLMVSQIDSQGRPRTPARLRMNAHHPALLYADGRTWLFWLTADDNHLYRAELTATQTLDHITALSTGLAAAQGQIFTRLSVGVDTTMAYVFWQTQTEGAGLVWWTSGKLTEPRWDAPRPLVINPDPSAQAPQAGYNHGDVQAATLGDQTVIEWALPAVGQSDTLPVAIASEDGIGVLYWHEGAVIGVQTVVPAAIHLIAPPALAYDVERDLALAWWAVLDETAANLHVVYSRR